MSSSSLRDGALKRSFGATSDLRRQLLTGLALAVSAALLLLLGAALDLELDAVVLLGVALGAVAALVPGATAPLRLAAFVAGVLVSLLGYVARAGFLPDTAAGRSVAVLATVLLAVGVVALGRGRLPLWAVLLGSGGFAGAYEVTFSEAPPLVLDTSVTAATGLLLCVVLGWLVCSLLAVRDDSVAHAGRVPTMRRPEDTAMDDLLTTGSEDQNEKTENVR